MSNMLQQIHVYFCNGSKRGKAVPRKGKADDLIYRSLSMFFYTHIYYIETSTSRGTLCDPSDARFQHMLIVFVFYLGKSNIRDLAYRQEILKCVLKHQHIIFINHTFNKPESILLKFRRATSWEKDQLKTLLQQAIGVNKNCYEETIFNLIRDIKSRKAKWENNQQSSERRPSLLHRKCSSASKLFDSVELEEMSLVTDNVLQKGKVNPISFFKKKSKQRQDEKNIRSPFWGIKRYQQGEGSRNFLFGHFSSTLKRKGKRHDEKEEPASHNLLAKPQARNCSNSSNQSTNTTIVTCSEVFEIRGTEVNLEKRLTRRPWVNWKSKAIAKVHKEQSFQEEKQQSKEEVSPFLKEYARTKPCIKMFNFPSSEPSTPPSSSETTSSDACAVKDDAILEHGIIRVGSFNRSDSSQSLPHITVTHSGVPGVIENGGSLLTDIDFLPRVSCLEDFEHFSKYAIYRPEKSRRRPSQRFLIIRYPDDLSLLQKRDSSSELASSVCSSPNPYDALDMTAGYESESPLQSPETRRFIYPQPVPAFSVESCFPPIDIPKNGLGVQKETSE